MFSQITLASPRLRCREIPPSWAIEHNPDINAHRAAYDKRQD